MTCPHCNIGVLPDDSHRCPVCGLTSSGAVTVVVADVDSVVDDLVARELEAQFRIERALKRGPASHVFLAQDIEGGRAAALKVIVPQPGMPPVSAERFLEAARRAAGLDHPHIVRPYRYGVANALRWYAMEYVAAQSLADVIGERGGRPLDVSRTWHIAQQLASVLDYAHRRGFAHGALRSRDVLLDDAGWVRLLDVGMALAGWAVAPPARAGAPQDLAPELFSAFAPVSPAADQYGLAVVVRECLAPEGAGALPSTVSAHVSDVLARAMSPRPGDRFPSVLDFVAALVGPEIAPRPLNFGGRQPARGPRRKVLLIEPEEAAPRRPRRWHRVGVALVVAIAGGLFWLGSDGEDTGAAFAPPPARQPVVTLPAPAPAAEPAPEPAPPPPPPPRRSTPTPAPAPAGARTARAPAPVPVPVPAPDPGFLSVNALPWAVLSVDGRLIGNTPQIKVRLAAGTHRFRLVRDGFRPYEAAVALRSGETVRITNITLDPIAQ
jgi:serine/threonine protein kinase